MGIMDSYLKKKSGRSEEYSSEPRTSSETSSVMQSYLRSRRDRDDEQRARAAREAALELLKENLSKENTAGQNSLLPSNARASAQRRSSGYTPVTGSIVSRPGRSSLWSDPNELRNTLMAAAAERSRSEFDRSSSKVTDLLAENTSRKEMERERDRLAVNPDRLSDAQISKLDELNRLLADTSDIGTRVADSRIDRDRAFAAMGSEEARAIQKKVLDAKVSGPSRGTSLLDNQQVRDSVSDWWGRTADKKKAAEDETAREQALSYDEVMSEIKKLDDEIANSGVQKKQNDLTVSSFGMDDDAVEKSKELDSVNQEISELYQRRQHYAELLYQKKAERELSKIDSETWELMRNIEDPARSVVASQDGAIDVATDQSELRKRVEAAGADYDILADYAKTVGESGRDQKLSEISAQFAKDYPVAASIGSVPIGVLEGVGGTLDLAAQKAANGFRDTADYRPIQQGPMVSQTIRGTIGERLEHNLNESKIFGQDLESFLYQTGMSAADSAFTTAATMGLGSGLGLSGQALKSFASAATTGTISMGAVTTSFADAKARGLDDNQAFSLAVASGLIEAATEKFSVEALLKEPKSVIGYIAENILTEASEETVSEVAGKIADVIIAKDRSEWSTRIAELMESGMTEAEATSQAFGEAAQDVAASGLGGALSGGAMGGAGLAGHAASSYVRERASESQLHQAIMQAAQERAAAELARDATPTMREFVEQEAARELEAEQEASVVPMQEEGLHRVPGQVDTAPQEALTGRETQEDTGVEGSDKPPRGDAQGATVQSKGEASAPVSRDTDTQGLYARKDRVLRAGASGKGKSVTVYGIESVSADDAVLRTSGGNQMKLSEAKFSDPAVQALYREAAGYDMRGANAFLRHYSGNLPVGTYKRSFDYFYRAGQMGLPYQTAAKSVSVTVQVLGKDAVQAAYNTGAAAAKADLALRKKAEVSQMPQGSFTDSSGYAPQAIAEISRLASKKLGVDIEYVPTLNGGNGKYLTGRAKILIAADSGNDFATLMHELGEHIKAQNPEGADAVARSLVGWYASRDGYSTAGDLIEHYRKTYEKAEGGKTFRDAMDELSFDMLGGLFGTEEGLQEFLTYLNTDRSMSADEKKNVLQRIADALRRVISEIREMLRDSSLSKAAREALQMEREQAQAMRRMVLDALDRATDNLKGAEKGTATDGNGEVKRSVALDSDGPYVMVNVDQDIFDGLSTKEMREQARKYILEAFRGKVFPVGDDSAAFVNGKSANEYANPANRRMAENLKQAKMRASTELDHLLKVSQFLRHENDDGRHADATGGWDVYRTRFMVGTEMFTGEVKIKLTDRGRLFYDVTKIERTARNTRSNQENLAAASGSSSYGTTITSSDADVNSQYMQKSSEDSGEVKHSLPIDETPSRKQLLRENEKLKQALSELREQFKLSKGHRLSKKSIQQIATRVLIDSSSSMKNGELTPKLRTLFDSIANGDPIWDDLVESSRVIASEVVEQSRNNRQLTEEAKEVIRVIRSMPVSLSEEQKNETAYHYGSYSAFRKKNFGKLNISDKKGVPLELQWVELAEIYPEIFDPETSALDMPVRLAEIMDTLQDSYESDYGFSKEDAITDLTYRILDEYWNVPEVYTYADKNKKKIDALKAKQRKRVQELRQELKDKYKKALAEQRQVSRERISKLRQENHERLDKQMARFQMQKSKSRAKRLETAEKQRLRRQITKRVQWLNNLLRHETDQKHIPEGMKRYVADLLKCFTGSSPAFSSDSRIKAQKAYKRIRSVPQIAGFYDEEIEDTIGSLAAAINGKKLAKLNPGELKDIHDIVDHIAHIVKSENEIFLNGKRQMVAGLGEEAIEHLDRHSRSKLGKKADDVRPLSAFNSLLNSRLLKPVYFFRQVGGPLRELYQEIRNGENTWARHMQEARERFSKAAEKAGYASWVKQKPLKVPIAGRKIEMTVGQAMSIYALSRREQGLSHLLGGGIVLRDAKTMKETTGEASSIALDLEAISAIINGLTDEQIGFVEDLQGYLSSDVAEWGNETSMQLFGIRKFTEETYFPIMSESNYLYTGLGGVPNDQRIKHTSFTKSTIPDAKTPVSILDFQAVWANHVDRMALYNALALPLENFNRVYNYRGDVTEDGEKSVKASLETAYGKQACSYIQHLMEDVNGGVQVRKGGELSSYLIRAFKKNAVMLSASVVIQQPSAIGRALAEIDPKYFATRPAGKGLADEMKRYAPVAFIKELGRFDTNTGAGIVDYLTGVDYSGKGEKMKALAFDSKYRDDVFSWAPQKADELTWVYIWQAVKNETAHKKPSMATKSEEFLQECGRRFEEVVDLTQVYDSVFSRSEMERSEEGLEKMATAFMAEPITSYNLLRYGMIQGAHGDRKYMLRAIGAYAVSMTLNSLLKALVQAGRDDDDTYGYWEKYIGNVIGNMIDDPLSMIPYVKDVISIFNGYDVERSDMALIADVVDWLKTLFLDGDAEIHDKLQALFSAAGALTGVPMKNVWRDGEMLYRAFDTILNQKDAGVNGAGIRDSILENLPRFFGVDIGTEGDRAYAALLDGNMDYFARMIKGKTGDQVDNMLRKALKENEPRVLEGAKDWANADTKAYMSMLEDVRADLIPLYRKRPGLGEEKDASRAALNDVRSSMVTLGDKLRKLRDAGQDIGRFSSYEEAQRAIKAFEAGEKEEGSGGDTEDKGALTTKQVIYNLDDGDIEEARSTIQEIIDFKSRDENGVATQKSRADARSSVKSGLTSHYKPLYQDGDESEKWRIRTMLTQLNGLYSHEDITKWNQRD